MQHMHGQPDYKAEGRGVPRRPADHHPSVKILRRRELRDEELKKAGQKEPASAEEAPPTCGVSSLQSVAG